MASKKTKFASNGGFMLSKPRVFKNVGALYKYVDETDRKVTCDKFMHGKAVVIEHRDGHYFRITNFLIEKFYLQYKCTYWNKINKGIKSFCVFRRDLGHIVYAEHLAPLIFFKDDVKGKIKVCKAKK